MSGNHDNALLHRASLMFGRMHLILAPLLAVGALSFQACRHAALSCDDDGARFNRTDLAEISQDLFAAMDAPLRFDPAQPTDLAAIKGRNTWILWTGGNEQ